MNAAIYDFNIQQGDTFTTTFVVSGITLGDYDGVRMAIRKAHGSSLLWDSASGEGSITINGSSIVLTIPSDITTDFDFVTAQYDIELVKDQTPEIVEKILRGTITLIPEITYSA